MSPLHLLLVLLLTRLQHLRQLRLFAGRLRRSLSRRQEGLRDGPLQLQVFGTSQPSDKTPGGLQKEDRHRSPNHKYMIRVYT